MFRNLMNGVSLSAMMLRDGNNDEGSDPKAKLREQLAKGNVQNQGDDDKNADDKSDNEGNDKGEEDETDNEDEESEEEGEEDDDEVKDPPEDETEDEKKAREAKEKEEAKALRKQDRMQRRIDKAIAAQRAAENEIANLKAQLAADPDKKLTPEEVESLAEAKAAKKLQEKEIADLQAKFDDNCAALQKAANKIDTSFDNKINEIAEDVGPIPSFMIGVLADMENGGEVLAFIANDDELAEELWKANPTKMTRKLVEISNQLEAARKKPKKQISRVPDPPTRVNGARVASTTITEADAKNMEVYTRKRLAQIAEKRKQQGF